MAWPSLLVLESLNHTPEIVYIFQSVHVIHIYEIFTLTPLAHSGSVHLKSDWDTFASFLLYGASLHPDNQHFIKF